MSDRSRPPGPFDRESRALTIGIVLGVTLFAFEALAVVTVAPLFVADLGGLALYGWVFSSILLTSLVGATIGGVMADDGPLVRPLLLGLAAFGVGLAISGAAPSMLVLIFGRVFQGLGGGMLSTTLYAAVIHAYPDASRARILALMSSAWVVPALLGPALAALVAETLHWRIVFWGILPLLLVVALLTYPAFSRLSQRSTSAAPGRRLRASIVLALGAGLFLSGIGAASIWLAVLLALPGAVLIVLGLRPLTPEGTLRLSRGLPAVVASRGMLFAAFAGVEAFLALMITAVLGYSTGVTGAVIAAGSISWAVGSWLQSRLDDNGADRRPQRLLLGTTLITVGIGAQLLALWFSGPTLPIVVAGWIVAGLGIGMAHSTSSVLAFGLAPTGEEGKVSAALQIADTFTAALSTGVGGALLAVAARLGWTHHTGVQLAIAFVLVLAMLAVVGAWRSRAVAPA